MCISLSVCLSAGLGTTSATDALLQIPHIDGAASGGPAAAGGSIAPSSGILGGDQPPIRASVAAKLTNLLPMASVALSASSGGVYVGDGLPFQ